MNIETEALWAECAWRMHQLQGAAQWLRATRPARAGAWLLRLLRAMETLHAFVNETVLLLGSDSESLPTDPTISNVLRDTARLVAAVGDEFDGPSPSREAFAHERNARLQWELDALVLLESNKCGKTECDRLRVVIKDLREREQSRAFHRGLLLAVKAQGGDENQRETKYSTDNFAYGSTPFDSWARVCASPAIQRVIQQWSPCPQALACEKTTKLETTTPIVVIGSSSGSLVFFTAALLGHVCTGIEILPFLHSVAEELKEMYKPTNCVFLQADVLATRVHKARLVVLTSQCWDADLYGQVIHKLEVELTGGSLVVDYRDGLSKSKHFKLTERVDSLRVSWNPAQTFFIYGHL